MKKFLMILAVAVAFSISACAAQTGNTLSGNDDASDSAAVQEQKSSDTDLYNEALKERDLAKCAMIQDASRREDCAKTVRDFIEIDKASAQIDSGPSLGDGDDPQ